MRERKPEVLADYLFVVGLECRSMQDACNPGYVVVREQVRGVFIHEFRGDKDLEPLVGIELQDTADAVQHLPTHTTAT